MTLKTEDGRPIAAQMQFISDLDAADGMAPIVQGPEQALGTLERWGLLRGHTQMTVRP